DAIWSCCRRKHGAGGEYLFGRFSIADCMYAPMAIAFRAYGAELSGPAQKYADTILANPWVQEWIRQGKAEQRSKVVLSSVSSL
ncbi:MAG: glutathione S-transferase C-terminal domain-containing protein, partial [Pseudohongiella sp.]|nr:glutathione S-transferase C-terminal domain-containing protein [Pseudohongiella sp.]